MDVKALILGGDGIGAEVVDASLPLLQAVAHTAGITLDIEHRLAGGALHDREGVFINDDVKTLARQADVILSDNLFGDLLSDAAAVGTGSLGMLPSASLGPANANSARAAVYEPVHGSAPDIAGTGTANPVATLLSVAMMAEHNFARPDIARQVHLAVEFVMAAGIRTPDIGGEASTREVADAVLERWHAQS